MTLARSTSGFSLLEVMCAVLILGLGVAGMTQGVATALRSSKESEHQTRAALMAAGRIETLRAEGLLVEGEREGAGEQDLAQYRWLETIHETDIEGLYEVIVAVRHSASDRLIYELRTLLFDPPGFDSSDTSEDPATPNRQSRRDRSRR